MFNATAQNAVFYIGALALAIELFVLLAVICSRGTEAQTLAKSIYAFLGGAISLVIDISIQYSSSIAQTLGVQSRPPAAVVFVVTGVVVAIWYGCMAFAEKVLLPKRDSARIEAILAAILAATLAVAVRAAFLTVIVDTKMEDPPVLLGLTVSAGVLFASLLYFANKLLRPASQP
jgi:hypothetical protein